MNHRRSHHGGCRCGRLVTFSRSRSGYGRSWLRFYSDGRCDSLRSRRRAFRICHRSRCLHSNRWIVCPRTIVGRRRGRWGLSLRTLRANKKQQKYIDEGNSFHILKCNQRFLGALGRALGLDSLMKFYVVNNCAENLAGKKSERSPDRSPGSAAQNLLSGLRVLSA